MKEQDEEEAESVEGEWGVAWELVRGHLGTVILHAHMHVPGMCNSWKFMGCEIPHFIL